MSAGRGRGAVPLCLWSVGGEEEIEFGRGGELWRSMSKFRWVEIFGRCTCAPPSPRLTGLIFLSSWNCPATIETRFSTLTRSEPDKKLIDSLVLYHYTGEGGFLNILF